MIQEGQLRWGIPVIPPRRAPPIGRRQYEHYSPLCNRVEFGGLEVAIVAAHRAWLPSAGGDCALLR